MIPTISVFLQIENGKRKQKAFSLGTTIKREALKKKIEFEEQYARGEIDPFNGWTPKKEVEKKRKQLRGTYMSLAEAADKFIDERSQANETTKKDYRRHLNMLKDQLGSTMPITQIVEDDIREFCFKPGLKPATQASYLRHLKVFFKWLYEKKYLKENLTKNIKAPKPPKNISQKTISEEDLEKIFIAFDKHTAKMKAIGFAKNPEQQRRWFKPMIAMILLLWTQSKRSS